jgi:hypothetical protein
LSHQLFYSTAFLPAGSVILQHFGNTGVIF